MNELANAPNATKNEKITISVPPERAAYRTRLINMVKQCRETWDSHIGQINKVKHWVELSSAESRAIRTVPYRTSRKPREAEKEKTDKIPAMKFSERAITKWCLPVISVLKDGVNHTVLRTFLEMPYGNHQEFLSPTTSEPMHWRPCNFTGILYTGHK